MDPDESHSESEQEQAVDTSEVDANRIEEISEPPVKKRKTVRVQDIDLREVLKDHPLGDAILTIYEHQQELCSFTQSHLCNIVATYVLKRYGA